MRTSLALLASIAVVAAGCGGDDDDGAGASSSASSTEVQEVTVEVDGRPDDINAFFFAYLPAAVTVHPGDSIAYSSTFTGEPHTITFGTLIQPAIDAAEQATPEQLAADEPPPAFEPILPYVMLPEGPGDANQVSANPCFVASGQLPTDTTKPCETREPAPFTGKEVFYNSGFLPDGETFRMKLADDIAPGTYKGFCMLHLTEMTSTINVVPAATAVPSPDEVSKEADAQRQALTASAKTALEKAEAAGGASGIIAGDVLSEEEPAPAGANTTVGLAQFTPEEVSVKSGEPVMWNINGPHSISFNVPEDARVVIQKGGDGLTHLVEKALAPAQFDVPPPPEGEPTGPPPTVDLGTWDGTGFASTGLQFGGGFTLTFSKPGSYQYVCIVHPDMEGTVNVT